MRIKPDFAKVHNNLGSLYFQNGNIDEAVACFRQTLRLRPGHLQAKANLTKLTELQQHIAAQKSQQTPAKSTLNGIDK
ncbi:MAG: tetratricopeptide repeat protein [Deltaproteobacteria bacterium]|nr:tetratricopeptide repeat protein [Deltaproteobacteria bacterium]